MFFYGGWVKPTSFLVTETSLLAISEERDRRKKKKKVIISGFLEISLFHRFSKQW